jgi:arabinan endo-1,5-alpha-L-arabinosidase
MVYHAYSKSQNGKSLLNIKPLYLTDDLWPSITPTKTLFKIEQFQKKVFKGK